MTQLVKYSEWEIGGNWYCNDTSDLTSPRGNWWLPSRALNLSPARFVELLIKKFKVDDIHYSLDHNVLIYSWKSQAAMRAFKNYINKIFREKNFKA